jgi:ABC-type phosphate transport system auxiliary subunit
MPGVNPTSNNLTSELTQMGSAGQTQSTNAMNNIANDIQSGNTQAMNQDMNQFALGQEQTQAASAMEGEIQDTIKQEIQNLSKA